MGSPKTTCQLGEMCHFVDRSGDPPRGHRARGLGVSPGAGGAMVPSKHGHVRFNDVYHI